MSGWRRRWRAVWHGEAESDSLNRLVIGAELAWPQVEMLRACRRHRQRIGSRYTEWFQNDVSPPTRAITEKLVRPVRDALRRQGRTRRGRGRAARRDPLGPREVELLDHDRILRNQLGLIEATVRTNV